MTAISSHHVRTPVVRSNDDVHIREVTSDDSASAHSEAEAIPSKQSLVPEANDASIDFFIASGNRMVSAETILRVVRSPQEKARRHVVAETRSTDLIKWPYSGTESRYTPVLVVAPKRSDLLRRRRRVEGSGHATPIINAPIRASGDGGAVGKVDLNSTQGREESRN